MSEQERSSICDYDDQEQNAADAADWLAADNASVAEVLALSDSAVDPVDDWDEPEQADFLDNADFTPPGSQPLTIAWMEHFAQECRACKSPGLAYNKARPGNRTKKTALEQGSRVAGRGDVRARLQFLHREAVQEQKMANEAASKPKGLTEDDIIAKLETIYANAVSQADKLGALRELNKMRQQKNVKNESKVDPAFLCDYLRKAREQGQDLGQLEAEVAKGTSDGASDGVKGPEAPEAAERPEMGSSEG